MAERDTRFGGNLETANTRPRVSNEVRGWHRMSNQPRLDSMNSGLFSARINDSSVNEMRNNYMQVEKGKNIYNDYKPYVPEVRDDMMNWDLGNWNVGVGEGKFNLGYTLPLGKSTTALKRGARSQGLDSLNVTDPSDFYIDKIIRDNPEEVMYNLMRQYPSEEMQEYYDQPIDRYQLDFGGPEIDKWIEENPGSTIGDLYDYLPELRGTGTQPGDFWPGGASI